MGPDMCERDEDGRNCVMCVDGQRKEVITEVEGSNWGAGCNGAHADAALELHIEPKKPRADCTISAARLTSVPACSCMPSNETR